MEPRYNEGQRHCQNLFAISSFFFFSYILLYITRVKKIVGYTEDFVIERFVVWKFHCTGLQNTLAPSTCTNPDIQELAFCPHEISKSVHQLKNHNFSDLSPSGLRLRLDTTSGKKISGFKNFRFRVDKSQWYMRRNVSGSYTKQNGE